MVKEETKEQEQIYGMFRMVIYLMIVIELLMNLPVIPHDKLSFIFINLLHRLSVFNNIYSCKFIELVCVGITCLGTTARKELKWNLKRMVINPLAIGVVFTILCFILYQGHWGGLMGDFTLNRILYAGCSFLGIMFIHQGGDGFAKYYRHKMGEDRFNFENESFDQETELNQNEYSVNIPMIFYNKGKMNKGWINIINPFRGTIVLGTPGSGKSFGIIDPFIRQHTAKGFTMMVYDYKFPTLAKTLFYQYCKNKHYKHLPENCGFHIVNFTDVEYSDRINPIQRKYIPDLAAASETAATLIEALNKGGGDKRGGSEAFFQNSAINFLAAVIYFFVNYQPVGWKNGKELKHRIFFSRKKTENGKTIEENGNLTLFIRGDSRVGIDALGDEVLNFKDANGRELGQDEDGHYRPLKGLKYTDIENGEVEIYNEWYEDEDGNAVTPDTISGKYSDMAHVLSFIGKSYSNVFDVLMKEDNIMSLMAPFKSAYENKAMDQLEGMVGTLRVNTARLVSPEAYWVFTGDDFDLKISDPKNPSYLVIANDPEKEQVIGSLNALVLNRLIARVNSKGNIPVSIIVDELPTLYFHKIDRLIGTARSNKVAVTLGFQELPQLESDYGKVGMQKIISTCGNIFMGAARNKETLEWASNDVFGKTKQISKSITIADNKISTTLSEHMDNLLPAAKIADMATGWLAGQAARDFSKNDDTMFQSFDIESNADFKTTKYFCKTNFDMAKIANEESHYTNLPKIYTFESKRAKEVMLNRNFKRVNDEVDEVIRNVLG